MQNTTFDLRQHIPQHMHARIPGLTCDGKCRGPIPYNGAPIFSIPASNLDFCSSCYATFSKEKVEEYTGYGGKLTTSMERLRPQAEWFLDAYRAKQAQQCLSMIPGMDAAVAAGRTHRVEERDASGNVVAHVELFPGAPLELLQVMQRYRR